MGNRGQIEIVYAHPDPQSFEDGGSAWLYSHWSGCFIVEYVRVALRSLPRAHWCDPECIERRLSLDIPPGRCRNPFNLESVRPHVGVQHRNVVVDPSNQTVSFVNPDNPEDVSAMLTFEEFANAPAADLDRAFHRGFGQSLTSEGRAELARRLEDLERCWPPHPDSRPGGSPQTFAGASSTSHVPIPRALRVRRARIRERKS